MKWLLFLLCLPYTILAQGVKLASYDVFVKKHRIEMEPVSLLQTPAAKLTITFSAVASDMFIQFTGAGWGAITVDDGNDLLFQLTNDSTVTVKADGLQTFEPGIPQSTYKHRYRILQADVAMLARNEIAGLRKYSFKEASDIRLPREAGTKLQKQSAAFLTELKNAAATVPLKHISARDVFDHIGDSVQFCTKVYNVRLVSTAEEKGTIISLQAEYSEPVVNLLIPDEDRTKISDAPDADFMDKDICVSGLLLLRNNVPTVMVRRKEQVKAQPPAAVTTGK